MKGKQKKQKISLDPVMESRLFVRFVQVMASTGKRTV